MASEEKAIVVGPGETGIDQSVLEDRFPHVIRIVETCWATAVVSKKIYNEERKKHEYWHKGDVGVPVMAYDIKITGNPIFVCAALTKVKTPTGLTNKRPVAVAMVDWNPEAALLGYYTPWIIGSTFEDEAMLVDKEILQLIHLIDNKPYKGALLFFKKGGFEILNKNA